MATGIPSRLGHCEWCGGDVLDHDERVETKMAGTHWWHRRCAERVVEALLDAGVPVP